MSRLHTQALQKFSGGPIHPKIIRHNRTTGIREAVLLDQSNRCLTYAITRLATKDWYKSMLKVDTLIKNGGLIGNTFKTQGYQFERKPLGNLICKISKKTQNILQTDTRLAHVGIFRFVATKKQKGAKPIPYGTAIEIYSPQFKSVNQETTPQIISIARAKKEKKLISQLLKDFRTFLAVA